jgi:predicted MFS family arabinose efflux permease
MNNNRPEMALEWAANWKAVLASAIGICFTILHFYTLGVFLGPLVAKYGWTKSDITIAPTISSVLYFFVAARIGRFASKVGARRIAIPGFVAYCCGLAMLGFAGPSLWTWYALWFLLAIAQPFANNNIWCLAVANRFSRSRGLALAVALCGTGVASAIAPYATSVAIARYGWANAYHLLGLTALVIGLPLIYWLMPRGAPVAAVQAIAASADSTTDLPGYTFREALRTRPFWILVFAAAVLGYGMPTLMLHFVSIGTGNHIPPRDAAAAAGLIGVAAIVGRLTAGVLLDTLPGRFVAAVMFAFPAVASIVLLNVHGSIVTLSIAAGVIGLCTGAEFDVLAVLVSRYMGMREFAAINGQVASVFGLGVGFGPALSSMVYDHFGSYTQLLSGLAIVFLLPASAVLFLGAAKFHGTPADDPAMALDEPEL